MNFAPDSPISNLRENNPLGANAGYGHRRETPSEILQLQERITTPAAIQHKYAELMRICGLPIVSPLTKEQADDLSKQLILGDAFTKGFRFLPMQAEAISSYLMVNSLVGALGVGEGKTLASYAIASIAYRSGIKKIIYTCPSNVYNQSTDTDLSWARTKISIPFPVFHLGNKSLAQRQTISTGGRDGLYTIPGSLFSASDGEALLYNISPGLVIIDECHAYKNYSAARTRRLMKFFEARKPQLVMLSGTITRRSLMDYWHLMTHALGMNSPLPLVRHLLESWASVLDAKQDEQTSHDYSLLDPLVDWAHLNFPNLSIDKSRTGYREAFKIRKSTAPGVVESTTSTLGVSLAIHNKPIEDYKKATNWEVIEFFVNKIENEWITPSGDEIECALLKWRWLYELCSGFYNKLVWPSPEELKNKKQVSLEAASESLDRAYDQHVANQAYAKELRKFLLDEHIRGLDTPKLVGLEFSRNGNKNLPTYLFDLWKAQKDLEFIDMPKRISEPVRVCDFKIVDVCRWAKNEVPKGEGGLVWYFNRGIGVWIYEYLTHYGFDALFCPAGPEFNDIVRDTANKNKLIVASITAHGTGKNLQHHKNQYIVQWPRSASAAEQMLGRTHRHGQEADNLIVRTNNTLAHDDMNFAACLIDSLYMHQTLSPQKMILAGYHPLPVLYDPDFLRAKGLDVSNISEDQRKILDSRFVLEK